MDYFTWSLVEVSPVTLHLTEIIVRNISSTYTM